MCAFLCEGGVAAADGSGAAVSSFEKQFRLNLSNLYLLLGEEPPAYLAESFTQGHGDPMMGGAMRPGVEH